MKDYFSYSTRDYREVVGLTDDHIAVLYRNDLYEHVREIQVTDHKIMILDHSDDNFFVDEEPEHKRGGDITLKVISHKITRITPCLCLICFNFFSD